MAMEDKTTNVTLYRGFDDRGRYVWSPFATKIEFILRYSNIKYSTEKGTTGQGPKGKIPYIDIGALNQTNGSPEPEFIGDSALIIETLVTQGHVDDPNAELTASQKATDLGLRALLEDKLYFFNSAERWLDGDNYYQMRDKILEGKPWLVRLLIGPIIYRKIAQTSNLQGCSRHGYEERRGFIEEIWQVCLDSSAFETCADVLQTFNDLLQEQRSAHSEKEVPFWALGTGKPTLADAVIFGFVVSVLICTA